jgi:hypothetical protein
MSISRNKGLLAVVSLITLAIYNVIAFVIPFEKTSGFWVGYGFSTLSILLAAAIGFYSLGRGGLKSVFYGLPLVLVAWGYLVAQVIVGFVFMAFPAIPVWVCVAVSAAFLGACLVGLIATEIGKEEIKRVDQKVSEKVFYIKSIQANIEGMAAKSGGDSLAKALKELAEIVKYSDPMSAAQLAALENEIEAKTLALEKSVNIFDTEASLALCGELRRLFEERNRKCKLLK